MDHLEYKDTNNKTFKTYYDKFKKMVKQDLNGDGWFLLVKDFPFKDGENLMFTAGEDIGKWPDKNLVSLYGKTKYILGRARKKGPVMTLLDFQEGDYVKSATEAGMRKELKEFFKGTGVSVRTFKSLKVTEAEPDMTEEDAPDLEVQEEPISSAETAAFQPLEMPKLNPTALKAVLDKAIQAATNLGVLDEQAFIDSVNNFKKAVPKLAQMKVALGKLNEYLSTIQPSTGGSQSSELEVLDQEIGNLDLEVTRLENLLKTQDAEREKLLAEVENLTTQYENLSKDESEEARKQRFQLARQSMEILQAKLPAIESKITESEKAWEENIDKVIELTTKAEELEASLNQ